MKSGLRTWTGVRLVFVILGMLGVLLTAWRVVAALRDHGSPLTYLSLPVLAYGSITCWIGWWKANGHIARDDLPPASLSDALRRL
jgi:hypothetical protein